ncbi:hypothetical protein KGQ25_00040 [Patescibacteria group bacterium]|nr:hypothetical protein [Patescibacteria group bacterium]
MPLLLGACASMSSFNGYVSASSEDAKKVEHGGYSDAATAQIAVVQNPDFNGGRISPRALKKIQEYSISCQRQIDVQLAGAGQSGVNGAVPYGVAGLGVGPAAKAAFAGASMHAYALYGGIAYLLPGAVNGLITGSYAMASAKGTCTRDFWEDVVHTDPDFRGTHVVVVYAGKAFGNSMPPALKK